MKWSDLPFDGPVYDESVDTVIRQSTISQCLLCEYRVKLKGTKGFLPAVSEPLAFGTCVHYLIGQDLLTGEPRLDLLTTMNEWVEQVLQTEYDWSISQVPNVRDFFSELTSAYRMWRTIVYPKLPTDILAVEKEMLLYLGEGQNGNLWLRGTPDVVFSTNLTDWKTAKSGWKNDKAQLSIQASLYMALAYQNLGVPLKKFHFWIYNKQKREWGMIPTERRVKDINSALITAEDYARRIELGIYTASPVPEAAFNKKRGWYCSPQFCEAWNICPVKYLADNVNENIVAIRSW